MKIFSKFTSGIKKIRKISTKLIFGFLLTIFATGALSPLLFVFTENPNLNIATEQTFAEDPKISNEEALKKAAKGDMSADVKQKIAEFASLIISVFTPIIAVMIKLIESLLSDDYIMGTSGGETKIAQVLYELWIVFRDVMNYLFIVILLFFAFMNVVSAIPGVGGDNYQLKTVLPKMILAIVVINLTWFGARVVFDVVDVSTRIVFGLPQAMAGDYMKLDDKECKVEKSKENTKYAYISGLCYPAYVHNDKPEEGTTKKDEDYSQEVTTGANAKKDIGTLIKEANKDGDKEKEAYLKSIQESESFKGVVDYGPITVYWTDFNYDRFNQGTIVPMFAFSLMQVQNLPRIANNEGKGLGEEGTGWSTLVINVLVALVIMIILIVLFALIVINLFFRVIVLWINIIFSPFMGLKIFSSELKFDAPENSYIGLAAFLKHAFAPVIMGLPLVIGFIMIVVGKKYDMVAENGSIGIATPMIDGVSNLHQLFYYVMCIAVLWVGGVKAIEATTSDFVRENLISPISSGVESAAKFIAKSPMYINFIPVAGKDQHDNDAKLSLNNLLELSNNIGTARDIEDRKNIPVNMTPERKDISDIQDKYKNEFTIINNPKYKKEVDNIYKAMESGREGDMKSALGKNKNIANAIENMTSEEKIKILNYAKNGTYAVTPTLKQKGLAAFGGADTPSTTTTTDNSKTNIYIKSDNTFNKTQFEKDYTAWKNKPENSGKNATNFIDSLTTLTTEQKTKTKTAATSANIT
jgi:hypothetical protein